MTPFAPLFRNPHLQTILGHYWPRPETGYPIERRWFRTEPEIAVLVESQRPSAPAKGEVVIVHGLEGSSQAGYVRGLSVAALHRGYAAHRMNMRASLYHGGLTGDLLAVLREMQAEGRGPFFVAGFSLGGNIVLKLAGELGTEAKGWIAGVCAVSTPIDLAACVRRIGSLDNRIYELRFVRKMRRRLRNIGRDARGLRSIFAIDDKVTAPAFGFGDAANYYRTQSSIRYLEGIRVPALLVQAKDDIFVPFEIFDCDAVRANPHITLFGTEHGGHLGFLAASPSHFWLDRAIMDWFDCLHD